MINRLMEKGVTLTWGLGLSNDPGSGATTIVVADAVVVAAGAPRGDHPQVVVAATGPMVVVVAVEADPMVVVAED
jgi:hypothetical protein